MLLRSLFLCALGASGGLVAACGGPPTESPRAVAATVVKAQDTGDVRRFLAVLPGEDQLGAAFDCGRADNLRAALRRKLDDVQAEFEARRAANFRMRLVAFDEAGAETLELAPGDVFNGCTVQRATTVQRARVSLSRTRGGRVEDTVELWTFLRFEPDGPWLFGKL